jgi:hypothetical protein
MNEEIVSVLMEIGPEILHYQKGERVREKTCGVLESFLIPSRPRNRCGKRKNGGIPAWIVAQA